METIIQRRRDIDQKKGGTSVNEYRDGVKKLIEAEMKNVVDEEMRKAAQELLEEQRQAIRQMVEEQRAIIREVVEEEKKAIWARAEELRQSISKIGVR